jgi:hypothetical protein
MIFAVVCALAESGDFGVEEDWVVGFCDEEEAYEDYSGPDQENVKRPAPEKSVSRNGKLDAVEFTTSRSQ